MLLEESFCLQAVGQFLTSRYAAGIAQRGTQRLGLRRRFGLRCYRLAAVAKGLVGSEMIVLAPARDVGPGDRHILRAGDLKRQFQLRIWKGSRGFRLWRRL